MLHIFLVILKIIGIALLVILGLLILIILSVLFVPIKYQINFNLCDNDGAVGVKGHAVFSYFGPFLRVRAVYDDDFSWKLKLLCFTLKKGKSGDTNNETEDTVEDTYEETDNFDEADDDFSVIDLSDEEEKYTIGKTSFEDSQEEKTAETLKDLLKKIKRAVKNLKNTVIKIKKLYEEFKALLEDERFKSSFRFVKTKILFFLKKILPVIKKAEFQFGTDDPALTGKILGAVCIFNGFSRQFIIAEPDFESDKVYVRGEAVLKGKIRLCHVAKLVWYYFFSEEVKYLKYKIEKTKKEGEKIYGRQ